MRDLVFPSFHVCYIANATRFPPRPERRLSMACEWQEQRRTCVVFCQNTSDKRCGSFQMARQKLLLEESKTKRQIISVPQFLFLVYGGHECAGFTFCALAVLSTQVNYRKGKAQRGAFFMAGWSHGSALLVVKCDCDRIHTLAGVWQQWPFIWRKTLGMWNVSMIQLRMWLGVSEHWKLTTGYMSKAFTVLIHQNGFTRGHLLTWLCITGDFDFILTFDMQQWV